jgi:hypothetical protein
MESPIVHYALFKAHPSSQPPFSVELGTGKDSFIEINNCQHIPDAVSKIEALCAEKGLIISPGFVLLYPIYMEAMDSDYEGTMHQIAWLIKDEADKKGWKFDRIGGYTGNTPQTFVPF